MHRKFLLVEDSHTIIKQVKFCLRHDEIEIIVAEDGVQGIEAFWQNRDIDLLISDVFMPHLDGIEMVRKIKKLGYEGPSVILTQTGDQKLMAQAKKIGVNGWLIKPFSEELLRSSVEKLIKSEIEWPS